MENLLIRKAVPDDLDTLLSFEQGIIYTERPFDPTLRDGPIHYYDLKAMMHDDNIVLLVAEYEGEIIGSGYARLEESKPYLKHHRHAYLGFMYVHPGYRGKGVNAQIVEALRDWARERQITELRLDVYCENSPAISAYEKVGFKKHMMEMRMAVDE